MLTLSRRTESPTSPSRRDEGPAATCICGHRGRFRLERRGQPSGGRAQSARCETCGGWQSMSTILAYAALRQHGARRSVRHVIALGTMVLVGLAVTTLASGALQHLGSPLVQAPQKHARAA